MEQAIGSMSITIYESAIYAPTPWRRPNGISPAKQMIGHF
jgi:hypothetical protein